MGGVAHGQRRPKTPRAVCWKVAQEDVTAAFDTHADAKRAATQNSSDHVREHLENQLAIAGLRPIVDAYNLVIYPNFLQPIAMIAHGLVRP